MAPFDSFASSHLQQGAGVDSAAVRTSVNSIVLASLRVFVTLSNASHLKLFTWLLTAPFSASSVSWST
jgi:hypothetical protein